MIEVKEITEMSQKVCDAFARLVPQLSSSASIPTYAEVEDLINSKAGIVLAATDTDDPNAEILGMMTLVVFRIPTGIRAWIEDVVVDGNARGKGIGEKLVRSAVERAKQGRREDRRPDVPPLPRSRQPSLPPLRIRDPRDEYLSD